VARRKLLEETKLAPLTDATLTTVDAIEEELGRSAVRGWYGNLGESIPDLVGLAWPLRIGGEAYAISVAGPRYRVEPRIEEIAAMLRSACLAIEHKN
jgi:DNA-binding IclR family transcriptional regulator